MDSISKIVGERIRNHRNRKGLNQEDLAERCGLHATYIGQLERGEKNATIGSIEKVVKGLDISFELLFEKIHADEQKISIASKCYSIVDSLNEKEQSIIFELLQNIIKYKEI